MSVSRETARRLELELAGVAERPHHQPSSFRVRGRIIATVPDPGRLSVMLDPAAISAAAAAEPGVCDQ